jgi:hypothetical protein
MVSAAGTQLQEGEGARRAQRRAVLCSVGSSYMEMSIRWGDKCMRSADARRGQARTQYSKAVGGDNQ